MSALRPSHCCLGRGRHHDKTSRTSRTVLGPTRPCSGQCKGNLDAESAVVRRGQCKGNLNERAVVRRGQCKEVNESGSMVLALAAALIVAAIAAGDHTATSPTQSSGQAARQRRNASHEQHVT